MSATLGAMSDVAIAASGLRKRFGEVQALCGVDLSIPAGQVFGLLGPNGAGKTTAIRILTTILRPDEGHAEVLGVDVLREPAIVRQSIGLAGQYAAVDDILTGRENLRLIGRLTHLSAAEIVRRADELLEHFDLTAAADRPVKTYSGGMRRRLDLAAALVHRPPVLFLDEPTTGLDITSRQGLWQAIEELTAGGTTVLLTTQYLEEADRLAQQLAVIDLGVVIAEGTPAQLKSECASTFVNVRLEGPEQAQAAARLLAGAGHTDVVVQDDLVEVPTEDGARKMVEVLRTLDGNGIVPAGITLREPSLDDVFLRLTGHRAEPQDAGSREADAPDGAVPDGETRDGDASAEAEEVTR
jgi:ABC-2 type transport system ATP-binding protein